MWHLETRHEDFQLVAAKPVTLLIFKTCTLTDLIAVFKIIGTATIPLLLGAVVAAKQLFLTYFCTDSLDSLSKCVLLIISEVPIPLSKQYY